MMYSAFIFLISFVLLPKLFSPSGKESSDKSTYYKMGEFSGYKAGVSIKPDEIKEYGEMDKRKFYKMHIPGWEGEKYGVSVFRWSDTCFVFVRKYYTNDIDKEAVVNENEYDTSGTRDLKLKDEHLRATEISTLLKGAMIKAHVEGDLNVDGKTDLVLVYVDSIAWTGRKIPDDDPKTDYHFVIFEKKDKDKYEQKFIYDFGSTFTEVGKIDIKDVNKDKNPEVILWTRGFGMSGWMVTADIFSRKKER